MKRVLSATLLILTIFGAANAQCGTNALLTTEVMARFGGASNVLTTATTISSSAATCSFLSGQQVCISDAGFTYFKSYLENFKSNFSGSSAQRDQNRYANVGAQLNSQNQSDQRTQNIIQMGQIFNQTIINFNMSGQQPPYDFSNFYGKVSGQKFNQYVPPRPDQAQKQNQLQINDNQRNNRPTCQGVDNSTTGGAISQGSVTCGQPNQQQQQQQQQQQGQGQQSGQGGQTAQGQQQQGGSGQQQQQGGSGQQQQQGGSGQQQQQGGSGQQQQQGGQRLRLLQQNSNDLGNGPIGGQNGPQNGVSQSGSADRQGVPMDNKGWTTLQSNLGQAKAKCGVAVMKQYYYATCYAALASTNSSVSGDTSNPKVQMSNDACSGYKSKCTDYFTFAQQAENVKANVDSANSIWAMTIYNIVSNSSISETDKSTALNALAVTVLSSMNGAQNDPARRPFQPINCNSTNTNGGDCNYVCNKVITATGFNQDNFNLVSSTTTGAVATSRELAASGSVILNSGSTGLNPDSAISDSNAIVVMSVQGQVDSSNARALVASLAVIMSIFALF